MWRGAKRWLVVTAVSTVLLVACGSDRDKPRTSTGPGTSTSVGTGGSSSTSSAGGAGGSSPDTGCTQDGVTCESMTYFGDCPADRRTLWEFLYYDTVILGDARIEFYVRTADTEDELAAAPFKLASTAEMGTEFVPLSNPIHLDEVLDPGHESRDYLELRFKRIASSDGMTPTVSDSSIQASCVEF